MTISTTNTELKAPELDRHINNVEHVCEMSIPNLGQWYFNTKMKERGKNN